MDTQPYTYILLRKDISPEQQIVQAAHAALEAGFIYKKPDNTSYLIVLEVADEKELLAASQMLEQRGIEHTKFFEPDNGIGYSALCTRPLFEKGEQNFFKRWKLYKAIR